ncbi:hypothetical protein ACIBHX_06955 [Nonomuraea sp. NPDC050536]|uniref:hypothetical protein n=1 Tax=Nonomuraea sp. NPDC050536 TaxID=3364366 RepID=UPI0037C69CE8
MDEFRMADALSLADLARSLALFVLLAPLCLALVMLPGRPVELVLAALGAAAGLAGVRLARQRRMARATIARFSSQGVEMVDGYGARIQLAWRHIERIGVVETRVPSPRTVTRGDRIYVRTGARQCVGLVGWGYYELPPHAPHWLWTHLTRMRVDPETGLSEISIPLGVIDPLWERGPMGELVRRRRPELFHQESRPRIT